MSLSSPEKLVDHTLHERPELLAPAGDRECIRAAVENGADAVYFGLDHGFNARARAANMRLDDLPEIMTYLRSRGVKGYVTLNTLIFSNELDEVEKTVRRMVAAGVDAVLVQDLGLMALIRDLCPELAVHASTQMTLTNAESLRLAESWGIERVVLARELSIDEIRELRRTTMIGLEVFVHGALCVAYSGQCLTSESFGGRSANRGQCAQACRLPYDLICDGRDVDLGEMKYLLSPQDLAAYAFIPDLLDAGVCSFKIEGRLKTPEYVANITRHYRQALDAALAGRQSTITQDDRREMELSFSRGFSPGWLQGCDHKMLVPGLSSAKRGILVGKIASLKKERVIVELAAPLAAGDGVVFEGDREHGEEQGGRVYSVSKTTEPAADASGYGKVELSFGRGTIDHSTLRVGQQLWKTDDPQLTARLRKTFTAADPIRKTPLTVHVRAAVGEPIVVDARAQSGAHCRVVSSQILEPARRHKLSAEVVREQLGRLGGTVYELGEVHFDCDGEPMAPLSVLGQLRHEMVRQLDASIQWPRLRQVERESVLDRQRQRLLLESKAFNESTAPGSADATVVKADCPPRLRILCRSLTQLEQVLTLSAEEVYVDFQDIREYKDAVRLARNANVPIYLATLRIEKPGERGVFVAMQKYAADGMLVRNLGGVSFCVERGIPFVADFSLNVTNELSLHWLLKHAARRVTASYDLNRDQLLDLVRAIPTASRLEVVVHQHMPMFHMEHCVFCAVLSPGTNKTNCGRPCDHHQVQLRDRIGVEHPLKADVGCRNTLFNAVPQSAAEVLPTLVEHGVRNFRIELLDEDRDEIETVVEQYRALLAGRVSGAEVWKRLRAANRVGITRGTLEERRNPLAIL